MAESAKATARVRFTVEYTDCGTWGKDCPLGQVWDQAADAALKAFERCIQDAGKQASFTLVSKPEVIAVLVPERRP
jgi:hypothetical protein